MSTRVDCLNCSTTNVIKTPGRSVRCRSCGERLPMSSAGAPTQEIETQTRETRRKPIRQQAKRPASKSDRSSRARTQSSQTVWYLAIGGAVLCAVAVLSFVAGQRARSPVAPSDLVERKADAPPLIAAANASNSMEGEKAQVKIEPT
ncbi:MAG TPA: hypothetical protein VHB77_11320, partial [Planctomycetaceae bacterium]|nr:hypothetical protein [Planctomycetaceae bacterium]